MNKQQIAIEGKITALQNRIKRYFADLDMSNPMSILANGEFLNELQCEYQQINTLSHFIDVIKHNEDVKRQLVNLGENILAQRLNNSTSQSTNAVELYRFNGKREAYIFLVEILKTAK